MSKVDIWRELIEIKHGRPFEALVIDGIERGQTLEEIAAFLDLPYRSFRYLLQKRGGGFERRFRFNPKGPLVGASDGSGDA